MAATKSSSSTIDSAIVTVSLLEEPQPQTIRRLSYAEGAPSNIVPKPHYPSDPQVIGNLSERYIEREESQIFCAKFSDSDDYLATSLGDGSIKVLHAKVGHLLQLLVPGENPMPCTAISWRKEISSQRPQHVLLSAYPDGAVIHWQAVTGKKLNQFYEKDNQILCCDYSRDGSKFSTAGTDQNIRIYDESTFKLTTCLRVGSENRVVGHSNRIFSAKFNPKDPNIIVSGGWDSTIQIWDIRSGKAIRSIYGPLICGDAIDFSDDGEKIITGSYLKSDPLQIWDFAKGSVIKNIAWTNLGEGRLPCMLYTAQFSHGRSGSKFVVAGGGGPRHEAKLFNISKPECPCIGVLQNFPSPVYTAAISKSESLLAVGGGTKSLFVYEIESDIVDPDFIF